MRKLLLIKHAKPLVDPAKSSELWRLADEGREQAKKLGGELAQYQPAIVISSDEPKAQETAAIVAEQLKIPTESAGGLREHDRRNVPHMQPGEFISSVELFFRRPSELSLGGETAQQALARFEAAVNEAISKHPTGNLAIVSHGTVIALFVEKHSDRNGFQIWREMSLPSFAVFDLPEIRLREVRCRI